MISSSLDVHGATRVITEQRRYGAFYTPEPVARVIAGWALAGGIGRVLEPSFGDGSFLWAVADELQALGASPHNVFGVDIDESAVRRVELVAAQRGLRPENLIVADFLDLLPDKTGLFKAVVGNPPFVRHHWLSEEWVDRAQSATGGQLSARSSAWAYFALRSVAFVSSGGRLALVLPGAVLHADYASSVTAAICKEFEAVDLIRVEERLFPDADEEAVLLLARGKGGTASEARFSSVAGLVDLASWCAASRDGGQVGSSVPIEAFKTSVLPLPVQGLLSSILSDVRVKTVADKATINIGVVTGHNRFFVRRAADIPREADVSGVPIVGQSAWLTGPDFSAEEFARHEKAGRKTRLLAVGPSWVRGGSLDRELATQEREGVKSRHHIRLRGANWWTLRDTRIPDAFLPYMGSRPRGLALNSAEATSTNAVHRVTFTASDAARSDRLALCASTWTSLFAVQAELLGRWYGGGVLKLEPGRAQLLPVIDVGASPEEVAELAGETGWSELRALADRVFLQQKLGLSSKEVLALASAADQLARHRSSRSTKPSVAPGVSAR